ADHMWTAIGDTSDDYNWYTKRATLAGVWGATVLYWLGDDSLEQQNTHAFIDRRIDDVMRIEKVKSQVRSAPVLGAMAKAAENALSRVKPPSGPRKDMPGVWTTPNA
ncbi:MAG: COQ9 family protein, partial [Pseudomonadota bacterium]